MFKNLSTGTKLVLLCTIFLVLVGATTYDLIAEKSIAIEFARKELLGSRYLASVRNVYSTVLSLQPFDAAESPPQNELISDVIRTLASAQSDAASALQTDEPMKALRVALERLSGNLDNDNAQALAFDALVKAQQLVARIADDSNLALDPDLDSYHVQDLVTRKLERFLHQLGQVQALRRGTASTTRAPASELTLRLQILEPMLQAIMDELQGSLVAAYRGNQDGSLKASLEIPFAGLIQDTNAYIAGTRAVLSKEEGAGPADTNRTYGNVLKTAIEGWTVAQSELDRLLQTRIDGLVGSMRWSIALIGMLAAVSIILAIMTHRHIVGPLNRLAHVASTVRKTGDYGVRADYTSTNEIGQLTTAFNDMLSELAAARAREQSEQAEFRRAARLTTMGAMTASIAHEINQPLSAIATNGGAAQRWLSAARPDLDEARAALKRIVSDAHRASQVIGSVRAMFKKEGSPRVPLAVNDVIEDVLMLVHGEVEKHRIALQTELGAGLPEVTADRTQLQQVFMNLIVNAIEAMEDVMDRKRLLVIKSHGHDQESITISVQDSGSGIGPADKDRIFEPFFTTKSRGMGMGLSICRSIIEAHGGRLTAAPAAPHGSVFQIVLPQASNGDLG